MGRSLSAFKWPAKKCQLSKTRQATSRSENYPIVPPSTSQANNCIPFTQQSHTHTHTHIYIHKHTHTPWYSLMRKVSQLQTGNFFLLTKFYSKREKGWFIIFWLDLISFVWWHINLHGLFYAKANFTVLDNMQLFRENACMVPSD